MEELGYAALFFYGLVFFTLVGIILLTIAIFGLRLKRLSGKIVFVIGIIFLLPLGGYAVTIIHEKYREHREMGDFFQAIRGNRYKQVKTMIDEGQDVNECNMGAYPSTPLTFAVRNSDLRIVRLLVENGAKINWDTIKSYLPLNTAIIRGDTAIVAYLLEQGAHVTLEDREQPISLASRTGKTRKEIVEILLRYGADAKDGDLSDAIRSKDVELVRCLLENGVSPFEENTGYESPLALAKAIGNKEIIELLRQFGAVDTPQKNKD